MAHEHTTQLFRRFINNESSQNETMEALNSLQTTHGQEIYSQLMDETEADNRITQLEIDEGFIEQQYQVLEQKIGEGADIAKIRKPDWRKFLFVAATLTGLLTIAGIYFFSGKGFITRQTAYGVMEVVTLPDGSTVTLNGNSEIKYKEDWRNEKIREVELRGEAFFSVRKTFDRKHFIVKLYNSGEIDVLGTEFNVKHRGSGSGVVLNSGIIRLRVPGETEEKELLMSPGDMVEFSTGTTQLNKKQVNPTIYTTWTEQKLVFENTSLKDIAVMLKETYNLDVQLADPKLLEKKISGTAPINDINIFLNALSGSFNLKVVRKNNQIVISTP